MNEDERIAFLNDEISPGRSFTLDSPGKSHKKLERVMQRMEILKQSKKAATLQENLRILDKEFNLNDETSTDFGNREFFEAKTKGSFTEASKVKIKHLLSKKAEMDFLYLPENMRREKESNKIKICGIFRGDSSDRCRCILF